MDTHARDQSVIVFGAGEAGRLALACLRREPGWNVVAFADDVQRQGGTFEGLPIVAPATLRLSNVDRIVVATQSAAQALPQLRALGIAASRIDLYRPAEDAIAPAAADDQAWPRILILSDRAISPSHGVGATMLRHFTGYPRERMLHAYVQTGAESALPNSYRVAPTRRTDGSVAAIDRQAISAAQLAYTLDRSFGRIDLVYATCSSEAGLMVLRELLDVLPGSPAVVHHVHDCLTTRDERFDSLLRAAVPQITELWANGAALAGRIRRAARREVIELNATSAERTSTFKREHRPLAPDFTTVMLGGSRMPWVLDTLRAVWAQVRRHHGIGPIRWYAHPHAVQQVEHAGVRLGGDIEYVGYLSEPALHAQLCAADLAILPLNMADEPEQACARASVPSRLGTLLAAGLPVFAAAGRNTETCRFIRHHGIGRCSTIADAARFTAELMALVSDHPARQALGQAARRFAIDHCDLGRNRDRILERIGALTRFDFTVDRRDSQLAVRGSESRGVRTPRLAHDERRTATLACDS